MLKYNHKIYERNIFMENRIYKYDIIRFILIFLVLFGHCLELFRSDIINNIYKIIYSFHMPLFIYISGRFAKCSIRKTLKHLIVPYILFQILYLIFDSFILGTKEFHLNFFVPYWILWYIFVLIIYNLLIYILPKQNSKYSIVVIIASIVISLLCGYIKGIGYGLSLSRLLVFFPFYLIGYYDYITTILSKCNNINKYIKISICILFILLGELYIVLNNNVTYQSLFGSYDYYNYNTNILTRLIMMIISINMIFLVELVIPNKKVGIITTIGSNTMCIYLFHGFILRLMNHYNIFNYSIVINLLLSLVITIILLLVFGNKYINKLFKKLI